MILNHVLMVNIDRTVSHVFESTTPPHSYVSKGSTISAPCVSQTEKVSSTVIDVMKNRNREQQNKSMV